MIVLGFTGTFAAGKDTAISIIAKKYGDKAFEISTSDLVRQETAKRGLSLDRENLQSVSNDMRLKRGAGIFAKMSVEQINAQRDKTIALVSGIRTPGEINELRKAFGKNFFLIAINAPIEIRYSRIKQRARAGENVLSFEGFKQSEEREMQGAEGSHSQNITATMKLADVMIVNDSSAAQLEKKIEIFFKEVLNVP